MKNNVLNKGFGIGNIIFIAALILALPLRIYQYVGGVIEPVTGFFAKNDLSIYLLYGILILATLAVLILGFLNRKKLSYETCAQKNPVLGASSALTALGIILDTAFSVDITGAVKSISSGAQAASPEVSTAYVIIFQAVFSLLAALFFAVLCITAFMGKTIASEFRLLSLAPVLWSMLRMVSRFMRTISFTRVSELLLEMFMLAFMIMFFMNFAQCNSKVNDKGCAWKIASYGLPTALLALTCFVPRIILAIAGNGDTIYTESTIEVSDLAVALFAIATVVTKLTDKAPEAEAVSEAAEETINEKTEE